MDVQTAVPNLPEITVDHPILSMPDKQIREPSIEVKAPHEHEAVLDHFLTAGTKLREMIVDERTTDKWGAVFQDLKKLYDTYADLLRRDGFHVKTNDDILFEPDIWITEPEMKDKIRRVQNVDTKSKIEDQWQGGESDYETTRRSFVQQVRQLAKQNLKGATGEDIAFKQNVADELAHVPR